MIESLIKPETAEKKPTDTFIAAFLFTILACILTMQIQEVGRGSGFLVVSFISIASAPFLVRLFKIEEKKTRGNLFQRHSALIKIFVFFFIGIIFASSLFFVLTQNNRIFSDQLNDLCSKGVVKDPVCIETQMTGQSVGSFSMTAKAINGLSFQTILLNNLKVLGLAFLFSFILGAGAIFLISWNATIIGVLIGKIAQDPLTFGSISIGNNIFLNYLIALPYTLLRLLPHGMFEFGAYFFGAIAGGILSVAIIKKQEEGMQAFLFAFKDSLEYLVISVVLITIGAAIEIMI